MRNLRPTPRLRATRLSGFYAILALVVGISFALPELASARVLSKKDLRELGFAGAYRGVIRASGQVWNGAQYAPYSVNRSLREIVPPRKLQSNVRGNFGQAKLTVSPVLGNDRRITIRSVYSDGSFHPFYGPTVASGVKRVVIRKIGRKNPRFVAQYSDSLIESQQAGPLLGYWVARGTMNK